MANGDTLTQEKAEGLIRLQLQAMGVEDVEKALKKILKSKKDINVEIMKMAKLYDGDVKAAIRAIISQEKTRYKVAKDTFKLLGQSLQSIKRIAASSILPGGMKGAIKLATDYRLGLLQLSAVTSRFGVGMINLEGQINKASNSLKLTRMETGKLYKQFAMGMNLPALQNFESLLSLIKKSTGSDAEAMGQTLGKITSLSGEYMELANDIAKMSAMSEKDSQLATSGLMERLDTLYITKGIDQETYRILSATLGVTQNMTDAEKAAADEAQKRKDLMQELQRTLERIALAVGDLLLPYLTTLADLLGSISNISTEWGRTMSSISESTGAILVAAIGMGKAMSVLSGLGMSFGGAAIGGILIGTVAAIILMMHMIEMLKIKKKDAEMKPIFEKQDKRIEEQIKQGKMMRTASGKVLSAGGIRHYKAIADRGYKDEKGVAVSESDKKMAEEVTMKIEENRLVLLRRQLEIIKQQDDTYRSQISNLSAVAERVSLIGDMQSSEVNEGIREAVGLTVNLSKSQELAKNILTERLQKLKSSKGSEIEILKLEKEIADVDNKINALVGERAKLFDLISKKHSAQIGLLQTQASLQSSLVQLADNYALGVGASVEMRMKEYKAVGAVIEELKKQYNEEKKEYELRRAAGLETRAEKTKLLETEKQILDQQLQQAGIVKSVRDGWISTISAMNAGFSGFTELVIDQNANTAQAIKNGAIVSAISGTIGASQGYKTSERLNQYAQIAATGRGLTEAAYLTEEDKRLGITDRRSGITRALETAGRGGAMETLAKKTRYTASAGLMTLGATANPLTQSQFFSQQPPIVNNFTINASGNIKEMTQDIQEEFGKVFQNAFQNYYQNQKI